MCCEGSGTDENTLTASPGSFEKPLARVYVVAPSPGARLWRPLITAIVGAGVRNGSGICFAFAANLRPGSLSDHEALAILQWAPGPLQPFVAWERGLSAEQPNGSRDTRAIGFSTIQV
jgi:hypothetical protein